MVYSVVMKERAFSWVVGWQKSLGAMYSQRARISQHLMLEMEREEVPSLYYHAENAVDCVGCSFFEFGY